MKSNSPRMNITLVYVTSALILLVGCASKPTPPPHYKQSPPYSTEQANPTADDPSSGQPTDGSQTNIEEQPAYTRPGEYPTARSTANPNEVISPYEPYDIINVEGFRSGQLARDPINKKIFRVP